MCTDSFTLCYSPYYVFQIKLSSESQQTVKNALTGESTVENLYYAISTMAYTGMKSERYMYMPYNFGKHCIYLSGLGQLVLVLAKASWYSSCP